MDLVLVSITAVSLVLALAMGLVVLKLLREERERSDTRVALLASAAAAKSAAVLPPRAPGRAGVAQARLRAAAPAADLFVERRPESPWGRRAAIAGGLMMLVAAGFAVSRSGDADTPRGGKAPALELLALSHAQHDGVLTITGTVRNPRHAPALAGVSATAVTIGTDGAVAGNGRAALDFASLAPGDQSPFVIQVPVAEPISRYRVAFRTAAGAALEHVDRRERAASAANGTGRGGAWAR